MHAVGIEYLTLIWEGDASVKPIITVNVKP